MRAILKCIALVMATFIIISGCTQNCSQRLKTVEKDEAESILPYMGIPGIMPV